MVPEALADAFAGAWPGAAEALPPPDALGRALADLCTSAQAAWPGIALDPVGFVRHLAARLPPGDALGALGRVHAGDLWLASACLGREPRALAELDERLRGAAATAARGVDRRPAFVDEVIQTLRHRLVIGEGDRGKLDSYSGAGPLAGWLRVVATRTALDLHERERRDALPGDDVLEQLAGHISAPERDLLKAAHGDDFRAAFGEALRAAQHRDRNLLRFYYVDQLTVEQIGALHGVHASTVSRWIQAARAAIVDRTRRALASRLGMPESQVDSLLDLAASVDLSLGDFLAKPVA